MPADADQPAVVETHTATLFFVGQRVYKRKKPLDLGFVDFRTLEARRRACDDEVALNRRLAPDVYLGVATVLGPDGRPCDALVVMRRMPDERRLSTLVADGRDEQVRRAVRAVARAVAAFHTRCATSADVSAYGSWAAVRRLWDDNLAQLEPFAGDVVASAALREVDELGRSFLAGREPLFAERQRQGCIRDGHGDLLCDDVFVLDDGPRILDCLEFDDRLRAGDVLLDVAFLAMDLERLRRRDLARALLDEYAHLTAERHPSSLEHFYVAYRALVRAKVASIRAGQRRSGGRAGAELAQAELADDLVAARELTDLARRHLRAGRVRMLLVGGLPGTGKSAVAAGLAATDPAWTVLRSDEIRRELYDVSGPAPAAPDEGLYSPERRRRVYDVMLDRARRLLELGESVILDASWNTRGPRLAARGVAMTAEAQLVELRCTAPEPVALDRLARRQVDVSDADARVARAMATTAEPWPESIALPTDAPLPAVLARAGALADDALVDEDGLEGNRL